MSKKIEGLLRYHTFNLLTAGSNSVSPPVQASSAAATTSHILITPVIQKSSSLQQKDFTLKHVNLHELEKSKSSAKFYAIILVFFES